MMHGRIGPMRPECFPKPFNVYSKKSSVSEIGRATKKGEMELKCSLRCILSVALNKNGKETRWFRVQAVHNKGEMDIDTVYYCEERGDLK